MRPTSSSLLFSTVLLLLLLLLLPLLLLETPDGSSIAVVYPAIEVVGKCVPSKPLVARAAPDGIGREVGHGPRVGSGCLAKLLQGQYVGGLF